jgi:photosystem II stability/assembly factor-like uncharacterized protein
MKISITSLLLLLVITSSNAQYWSEQTSNVTATLTSVSGNYVTSAEHAWICGYNGTVLKTTNRGTNWINVSGGGIPGNVQLINIAGIDPNTAITAGYINTTTFVYRTSNGGANWNQVFTQPFGLINAILFYSNVNGFMQGSPVGGRWSLWTTTNAGLTWDSTGKYLPQTGSDIGYNNSMYYLSPGRIWFGTSNSKVYYSSNYGSNWSVQSVTPEVFCNALWFSSNGSDGLVGGATNMMRTTNSGVNWSVTSSLGSGSFGGFTSSPIPVDNITVYEYVWYVRSSNLIYFSNFNVQNWIVHHTAPSGTYRHLGKAQFNGPFWAVRTLGGISYHPWITGRITRISNEIPNSFKLYQNFPNPFNPTTTIHFSLPVKANVMLRIFDIMGKEITRLIEGNYNAGSYEVFWDASEYSSGIYYYSLSASSENDFYIETKKMALVK